MPHLSRIPGVLSTGDVLQWLSGNATKSLDILAQYWQFLPQPNNPKSGDYGFSKSDMRRFGADEGRRVYKALENAADRKIKIRIVQHSGFAPDFDQESADLAAGRPNVENATVLFEDWWGSGVVHAKVWISDKKDVYIGSANNDWKSLTQVKELGIYFAGCPHIAKTVEVYFQNLWTLSTLNSTFYTKQAWDTQWQVSRKVPCWSHFLQPKERCSSTQHMSKELGQEEFGIYNLGSPSTNSPSLPSLGSSNIVAMTSCGRENGSMHGLHSGLLTSMSPFREASFLGLSSTLPQSLSSPIGIASAATHSNQAPLGELSHSLSRMNRHVNYGFQGLGAIHPHSLPDVHNGANNGTPYNLNTITPVGVNKNSRTAEAVDSRHLHKVGSGNLNGHSFDRA
uniref:PLD phosphodiesterase domain-containing protein n=5 Tax=Zea mays TaxID=4577 RepID=A0A804QJ26_MAIZE